MIGGQEHADSRQFDFDGLDAEDALSARHIDVLDAQSLDLDWQTLSIVTMLGILGSHVGARYARKMPQDRLERWCGDFLILMGLYILARSAPEVMGLMT